MKKKCEKCHKINARIVYKGGKYCNWHCAKKHVNEISDAGYLLIRYCD
jgi:hypothetical protein